MAKDISFQLYSARNFALSDVLPVLAELGYTQVEGFGGLYGDLKALRKTLDAAGLKMPTAHVGIEDLSQPARALEIADALGAKVLICPWLAPHQRPKDAAGWTAFGQRLQKLAEPYVKAGLIFGYHNHDFEFQPLPDGRYPMDLLLEAAPGISAEVDIAWIVRGKADPTPWLERHGKRIIAVHVKDVAPAGGNADEDGWADVGHGTLPWKDLLKTVRTKTSAQYLVAEHDNPKDINRFARRSMEAIRSYGD